MPVRRQFEGTDKRKSLIELEDGYALASVLYIVTILSILAALVVSVYLFERTLALREVSQLKAEFAAESGIANALASCNSLEKLTLLIGEEQHSFFDDNSEAIVKVEPWGAFLLIETEGKSLRSREKRKAIVAGMPSQIFDKALVYANGSHQLVFTGTSSIHGDVIVGMGGATVGTLRNRTSPIRVPVEGAITKAQSPALPSFQLSSMEKHLHCFDSLLQKLDGEPVADGASISYASDVKPLLRNDAVPDTIQNIFIKGDAVFDGQLVRETYPLYIIIGGTAMISSGANIRGLVAIISLKEIVVSKDAHIDQCILYSKDSVILTSGSSISGQIISPTITFKQGSTARYPSVLYSCSFLSKSIVASKIHIENGAKVEGMIILRTGAKPENDLMIIDEGSTVIGGIYSEANMTLDGNVYGTVLTQEFTFTEQPTQYKGWLRSGTIDRSKRPAGFVLPPGFTNDTKLLVLDWL